MRAAQNRWLVALAALLGFIISFVSSGPPAVAATLVNGAGSSFAALEISQWKADTARSPYNLTINYSSQGSTFGRLQYIANKIDFGASDIPFQASANELTQLQQNRCPGGNLATCFTYVPVSAGGLAFMYNLTDSHGNRVSNLQLTRQQACQIFTGQITNWNQLSSNNPGLASVNHPITEVTRSDGAGESFVFSQFCIAVDKPDWDAFVSARSGDDAATAEFRNHTPTSTWPLIGLNNKNFDAQSGADNAANAVADPVTGPFSITYVAAGYAKVRSFPTASLQNAAGVYTQPDETNVTVALAYATPNGDGTFTLNFQGADPRSYFPSTYSYIIAQTAGFDPGKGAALGKFLCYAVSKGQEIAPQLRYARLSAPLVALAVNQIGKIPGAPQGAACPVAGASPPPAPITVKAGNAPPLANGAGAGGGGGAGGANGGAGGASGGSGAVPCTTGTSGTSGSSGSSTTAAGGSTSSTTTTVPCTSTDSSASGGDFGSNGGSGGGGSNGGNGGFGTSAASTGDGFSNGRVLWMMAQGAGLVAVGAVLTGRWRKST